jgi:Ca2+-binding RTX toxin-like protein
MTPDSVLIFDAYSGLVQDVTPGRENTGAFYLGENVADSIAGRNGNDFLEGFGGDDMLYGGAGDDNFDGGAGNDTAVFSGLRAAYTITPIGANIVEISGSDGSDLLTNVEFAKFDDITEALLAPPTITSNGGGDNASVSVAENTIAVTTVTATDLEGTTLVYAIVGGVDQDFFEIGEATGALSFITAPDWENPIDDDNNNIYLVEVSASDGILFDTQAIAVEVTDAINEENQPPSDIALSNSSVEENSPNGTLVVNCRRPIRTLAIP